MSILNGIKEGNVVRIKFKSIPDITKGMKIQGILDNLDDYDIGSNINAIIIGGDYVTVSMDLKHKTPYIEIDNHLDGGTMVVYEKMVDTIEVIEVANKFVSEDCGIMMIQVEDKLYINGVRLENDDYEHADDLDKTQLDRFTAFMEKFLVAKVFEDSLDGVEE